MIVIYVNLPVNPSMSRLTFFIENFVGYVYCDCPTNGSSLENLGSFKYIADGIFTRIIA